MNVTVHSITARTVATTINTTTTDISAMLMGGSDPDEGVVGGMTIDNKVSLHEVEFGIRPYGLSIRRCYNNTH